MNRDQAARPYGTDRQETDADALADPRDGGCDHCGRETTAVPLTDFGLERGQLCPVHGIVDAAKPIATDGGRERDGGGDDADDDRPADCSCVAPSEREDGRQLPCFPCYNAGFRDVNPEVTDR